MAVCLRRFRIKFLFQYRSHINKILMKKYIILLLLLVPAFAAAAINQNLYYGMQQNSGVKELQQFLIGKGFLSGSATVNFYSLTLDAVKKYQTSQGIGATGYVGALTRKAIKTDELSGY